MKLGGLALIFLFLGYSEVHAKPQEKQQAASLSLQDYLLEVKAQNPAAKSLTETAQSLKLRLKEADGPFTPELYSEYHIFDNREEPPNPFMAKETRGRKWQVGVREQTTFGLSADAFIASDRLNQLGINPNFVTVPDYEQSHIGLSLSQSLWRNGFGESNRADLQAAHAQIRLQILKTDYELKNLLLRAENTYWSLVSFDQIIQLQKENVDRSRKLRDHMHKKARLRLFDEVDAMQTEASFQQRELELETSLNDRAALSRDFNTLRGKSTDEVEPLQELPANEMMLKQVKDPNKRMSREDFRMIAEQAVIAEQTAQSSISSLHPKLDLVGSISSYGLDKDTSPALRESQTGKYPDWNVGVVFSVPLDYRLIGDIAHAFKAQKQAAASQKEQARFEEDRAWDDILQKNKEAQSLFERSVRLEDLMTKLVNSERRRLLNGRSTTLQTVTIEKNLADAQIMRVRSQLSLLQVHNLIKQFEEEL